MDLLNSLYEFLYNVGFVAIFNLARTLNRTFITLLRFDFIIAHIIKLTKLFKIVQNKQIMITSFLNKFAMYEILRRSTTKMCIRCATQHFFLKKSVQMDFQSYYWILSNFGAFGMCVRIAMW